MTNLVEILKNAPKGLELYSLVYGRVKLNCVKPNDSCPIEIEIEHDSKILSLWLDEYGRMNENGECLLFPSKEHKDWNGWQKVLFKEGHYITHMGKYTLITSKVPKCGFPKEDDYLDSRFATQREIEIYNQCKSREIIHNIEDKPFTIDDFKPFDKVLVKHCEGSWRIQLFSYYNASNSLPYTCFFECRYKHCVPYNDETKHLLGTTEEYNGKYKTW